jgi:Flp pilus assembly protein TadG
MTFREGQIRRPGGIARAAGFARDVRGAAAIEFAFVTPVFCLLLVGAIDLGGALFVKFKLDSAVTAGANFAQVNVSSVNSTSGQSLANNIATIVETSQGSGWADNVVTVNDGPTTTTTGGSQTTSGTAANADSCYCPSGTAASFTWGSTVTCGTACSGTNTGYAGKFVVITASKTYTPIFSNYNLINGNTITSSAAVQVQ